MQIDFVLLPPAERMVWFRILTRLNEEYIADDCHEYKSMSSWVLANYGIEMLQRDPTHKPELSWGMQLSEQTATYLLLRDQVPDGVHIA